MKTLQESAEELKKSVKKLHKARMDFLKAYENSLKAQRYPGDDYFQSKFGHYNPRNAGDLTQI